MLDTTTLEQRLLVLEAEVAALKQQGRAFRDRDRPEDVDEIPA
jgi:hypothetical protein